MPGKSKQAPFMETNKNRFKALLYHLPLQYFITDFAPAQAINKLQLGKKYALLWHSYGYFSKSLVLTQYLLNSFVQSPPF